MLNVECRFELPRIVQALQARGHGTLCFYGPPGTGKTALAEHIAQTLWAAADHQAGQRPDEQVCGRDRAEHGRHVP
jgi:SpoVK/Ycf46/Vps4 family AAA+-type ATPase